MTNCIDYSHEPSADILYSTSLEYYQAFSLDESLICFNGLAMIDRFNDG